MVLLGVFGAAFRVVSRWIWICRPCRLKNEAKLVKLSGRLLRLLLVRHAVCPPLSGKVALTYLVGSLLRPLTPVVLFSNRRPGSRYVVVKQLLIPTEWDVGIEEWDTPLMMDS